MYSNEEWGLKMKRLLNNKFYKSLFLVIFFCYILLFLKTTSIYASEIRTEQYNRREHIVSSYSANFNTLFTQFNVECIKTIGIDPKMNRVIELTDNSYLGNQFVPIGNLIILILLLICLIQTIVIYLLFRALKKNKIMKENLPENKLDLIEVNQKLMSNNHEMERAMRDVKTKNSMIEELIYVDSLTKLNNRYSITKKIDHVIKYRTENEIIAVFFIDMDHFKNVNDNFGHDVGDKVIKIMGNRLNSIKNDKVNVGRFGGDEFIILLHNEFDKDNISTLINTVFSLFQDPLVINDSKLFITISMGVVLSPENGTDSLELIKKADLALYKSKSLGRNRYSFFDSTMENSLLSKVKLQSLISKAFKDDDFYLNYQPYIDLKTNEIVGVEALIRWVSDELGYVSPYELIVNAEEMGLINEIGEWVLEQSCQFLKELIDNHHITMKMSVNISIVQLMTVDFYEKLIDIINKYKINPNMICLEMTETILLKSIESGITVVEKLRNFGVNVAIDDFGSGYSSLQHFKELPIDIIKIEKKFIDNILENEYDKRLIEFIVNIAHSKSIKVVAEGVETIEQLDMLRTYDVDIIQGFYFSEPLLENNLIEYIKNKKE